MIRAMFKKLRLVEKMKVVLPAVFVAVCIVVPSNIYALTEDGYKELHVFSKVLHIVEDNYVEKIDEKDTINGAIRGMLRTLDPHSVYMSPEVYKELKVDTSGRFNGVGLEVAVRDGWITVITPIQGSPAEKAGLQTGDRIIKIDGVSTENMDLIEAVKLMRGRRGSQVNLTIRRPETKQVFDVYIVRTKINVPSVKSEILDGGYGYISIMAFQENTAKSVRKAIKKLNKHDALKGLIIDIRKNPGGLLEEAVGVADLFMKEGVIVTTESRGKEIERYEAGDDGEETDVPIIVLVDGGSASASEILAGALQDNQRAIVVGTQTFGKGSVQTVFELGDGSALKLTIAKYFTPDGVSIQAQGIGPNVTVPAKVEDKTPETQAQRRIREADLSGHLKSDRNHKKRASLLTPKVRMLLNSGIVDRNIELARAGKIKDLQKQVALDFLKKLNYSSVPVEAESSIK